MEDPEEKAALTRVLNSYFTYEQFATKELITPRKLKYQSLNTQEQELIPWFPQYLETLEHCIKQNGEFTRNLAMSVAGDWGVSNDPSEWSASNYADYDKVKSIMKQILREWSEDAQKERDISFNRIFGFLEEKYPIIEERQHVKVLIPGIGLGRLNFELVKRGFSAQGNEYSYHMLLASNYILNHSYSKFAHTIYPFIHGFSNQVNRNYQTRPIYIPDVHNGEELLNLQEKYPDIPVGELMSIASGSFIDLYGSDDLSISPHYSTTEDSKNFRQFNKGHFDVIITNFFLDTSSNVIEYLKTINHSLQDNGHWINFGPLLWHFENADDVYQITKLDGSTAANPVKGLELSRDDLIELCGIWFRFQKYENEIQSSYGEDLKALGSWKYKCEYWIATKK